MITSKTQIIEKILGFSPETELNERLDNSSTAFASTNFALIKYWGKDNEELMIPMTDSLSISLGKEFGTQCKIETNDKDELLIDEISILSSSKEYTRLFNFVNLFRPKNLKLKITTKNTFPISSGLATSASAFASVILALNDFFNWKLDEKKLSVLARLGSVSASRSIYGTGFVRLYKDDGINAYSESLEYKWDELYVGLLQFNAKPKKVGSSDGMRITQENSFLHQYGWEKQVEQDMRDILNAIKSKDWLLFQNVVQRNMLAMHATAISAGIIYWSEESLNTIKMVLELQKAGIEICCTEDAGEHIKLIAQNKDMILRHFPSAKIIKVF